MLSTYALYFNVSQHATYVCSHDWSIYRLLMCTLVDQSEKGLPRECSNNVQFRPPLIISSDNEAVDDK